MERSNSVDIDGLEVRIPTLDDLLQNKRASGSAKDLADVEALEALKDSDDATDDDKG